MNFYNDIDEHAAAVLDELIFLGEIPHGVVDQRSIEEIEPDELRRYEQVHFFAGIGGWSLALRLANWPKHRQVWTGSCPCQPFSAAGKGEGFADERHLWPHFHRLIGECRPAAVYGEQVAGAAAGAWLDLVLNDLEALDYAGGAIAFPAASIGAKHVRQRTYWAAYSNAERHKQSREESRGRPPGRVGRIVQPVSWDAPWQSALSGFRAVGDGLPRSVGGSDCARNAIVPAQAAEFIVAAEEARRMMLL